MSGVTLQCFVDIDLGGDLDNMKSTSDYVFILGGIATIWMSRLQNCVPLSTIEVEYVALFKAGKEMIWLKKFLNEMSRTRITVFFLVTIMVPFVLQKNLVFQSRVKHIDLKYQMMGHCH